MLHVFSGSDVIGVRKAAHAHIETRDAALVVYEAEEVTKDMLQDRAGAQSLFGGTECVLLDMPFSDERAHEMVLECAALLAESKNDFYIIEGRLSASDTKALKTHASTFKTYEAKESVRFNIFSLAEALARRDKKTLWLLYHDAVHAGLSAEEISGTLSWQLKTMRLASRTKSAKEAGLKDFVYTKAKRGAEKFTPTELDERSRTLVSLYHDARLGGTDMDIALERWVLTI